MPDIEKRLELMERNLTELRDDLRVLRRLVPQDHGSALNKIRYVTEKVLYRLCAESSTSWGKAEPTLENMIGPLVARGVVPKSIAIHVRTVQANASPGSHYQEDPLSASHVHVAQLALIDFLEWYYSRSSTASGRESRERAGAASPQLTGLPRVSATGRGARHARIALLVAAGATVAVTVGAVAWHRRGGAVAQAVEPRLALAMLQRHHDARDSQATSVASITAWQAAERDFAAALAASSPGAAPPRWRAGRIFCAGQVLLLRGQLAAAIADFDGAAQIDPSWASPHVARSAALRRQDDADGALAAAQRAQQLEPTWWVPVSSEARALVAGGRVDEAIQSYRRALALAPDTPTVMADLAMTYDLAGLHDEAVRYARQALARDADIPSAHVVLAQRALAAGDGATALAEAERALSASPTGEVPLWLRAEALLSLGRADDARDAFDRLLATHARTEQRGAPAARLSQIREALARDTLPPPLDERRGTDTAARAARGEGAADDSGAGTAHVSEPAQTAAAIAVPAGLDALPDAGVPARPRAVRHGTTTGRRGGRPDDPSSSPTGGHHSNPDDNSYL